MNSLALKAALLPIESLMVFKLVDHDLSEQRWPCQPSLNGKVRRSRCQHTRGGLTLLHELRSHDAHAHLTRGAMFQGFGDFLADAFIELSLFTTELRGQERDLLDGKVLWQRLSTSRLTLILGPCTRVRRVVCRCRWNSFAFAVRAAKQGGDRVERRRKLLLWHFLGLLPEQMSLQALKFECRQLIELTVFLALVRRSRELLFETCSFRAQLLKLR